jgi:hypothetical protein
LPSPPYRITNSHGVGHDSETRHRRRHAPGRMTIPRTHAASEHPVGACAMKRRTLAVSAFLAGLLLAPAAAALAQEPRHATLTIRAGEPERRSAATSTGTSPSTSAAASTTGCGSGRARRSRTRAASARTSSRPCARSGSRTCAGRAAASPINTTGGTGSGRRRSGPARQHPLGRGRGGQHLRDPRVPRSLRADRRRPYVAANVGSGSPRRWRTGSNT